VSGHMIILFDRDAIFSPKKYCAGRSARAVLYFDLVQPMQV
jgi:hypothetical protein